MGGNRDDETAGERELMEKSREIWLWQRIVSPHMAGLATALASRGHKVVYIAEESMSQARTHQGWLAPEMAGVQLELCPTPGEMASLARSAAPYAIHICQGIRANGHVGEAQRALAALERRQWIVMETVEDAGLRGAVKRVIYGALFRRRRKHVEAVLATGAETTAWVAARGMPTNRVFPFAYFLPNANCTQSAKRERAQHFRLIYVGQLIERKRVDFLLDVLARVESKNIELTVVGSGPQEEALRTRAEQLLGSRLRWLGSLPMDEVPAELAAADCLVLPSRHDGWGAVVSEALIAGTPAICSDHCGAAEAVRASSYGDVFRSGDADDLARCIDNAINRGRLEVGETDNLMRWAHSLTAPAGAAYVEAIARYLDHETPAPAPPWRGDSIVNRQS